MPLNSDLSDFNFQPQVYNSGSGRKHSRERSDSKPRVMTTNKGWGVAVPYRKNQNNNFVGQPSNNYHSKQSLKPGRYPYQRFNENI